jgi:hypothetical protein
MRAKSRAQPRPISKVSSDFCYTPTWPTRLIAASSRSGIRFCVTPGGLNRRQAFQAPAQPRTELAMRYPLPCSGFVSIYLRSVLE